MSGICRRCKGKREILGPSYCLIDCPDCAPYNTGNPSLGMAYDGSRMDINWFIASLSKLTKPMEDGETGTSRLLNLNNFVNNLRMQAKNNNQKTQRGYQMTEQNIYNNIEQAWKDAAIHSMVLTEIISGKKKANPAAFTFEEQERNWNRQASLLRFILDCISDLKKPQPEKEGEG